MKKIYVFAFFIVVCSLFICVALLCPTNKQFHVQISDVEVTEIGEVDMELITSKNKFDNVLLDEETVKDITKYPEKYKQIRIHYLFENESDTIDMLDLRVNYKISEDFEGEIIAYNDSDLVTNIDLELKTSYELFQNILLKANTITDTEIIDNFLKNKSSITYFTGPFVWSNGNAYYGVGKKEIIFKLMDLIQ